MIRKYQFTVSILMALAFAGYVVSSLAAPKGSVGDIKNCVAISSPGTYNVTVDLPAAGGLLPSGNCIEIETSSVVLNLNDHSITGAGTGIGISDGGYEQSNVTIRQGTVTGFATAVDLAASIGSVVEYIHASENAADGISLGMQGVARFNVALKNDRGLVMTCPANAVGNSSWDNTTEDYFLIDEQLCTSSDGLNSFGTSGGNGTTCASVGLTDCAGSCTDTSTDEANCGGCGNSCYGGELCIAGICELNCQTEYAICSGNECSNLLTDTNHCGACGISCSSGQTCIAGACTLSCQSGLTDCAGSCTDTSTDEANCGGCGNSCGGGELCIAGACTLSCQSGLTDCGGICTDLLTDEASCGSCVTSCGGGELCIAGVCALSCQSGYANCSGNECTNLLTDTNHCGACGVSCSSGQTCTDGACADP